MNSQLREEITHLHAQLCSGLADPNRIMLLYTLADAPSNVSDLAESLGLPQPTVSRHLKVLKERRLVTAQREGQSVFYSLTDERVIEALDMLRAVLAAQLAGQVSLAQRAAVSIMPVEAEKQETSS